MISRPEAMLKKISSNARMLAMLMACGIAAACSSPKPVVDTRPADAAAIKANALGLSAAAQAKDLDKTLAYYTDDAIWLEDKGPMLQGKAALRSAWQQVFAQDGPGLTFTTTAVDVAKSGDLATEYGTYLLEVADKNGHFKDQHGKYMTVWKKQPENTWKATMDIDNMDAPLPPQATGPARKSAAKAKPKAKHHKHH
jgi:uncharacterized protein (TIGR02246 family)